jgi:threonyl-tRNA synthetase
MEEINIVFPDGKSRKFEKGITVQDIIKSIGERLFLASVAAKVDDELVDLSFKINKDSTFRAITFNDPEGKDVFHHSASHVLAHAVKRIFPDVKLTIGPSVEGGFYYDFDSDKPFTPEDLERIEKEMKKITEDNISIERLDNLSKEKAKELHKDEPYKLEMIDDLGDCTVSCYKQGDFTDLCKGPHVSSTGKIKAFKLTKLAGAYWKGCSENKQLQRIYGVAFPDKKMLKDYLHLLEEAEKRDHRKIGKELKLFSFHDEGQGFPFMHPKGMSIINELLSFWREVHTKENYVEIKTPLIMNRFLWEKSGHWFNYRENMYTTKIDDIDCAIKPMNCPGAMLWYGEDIHSYKEFPLRVGEIGLVHRHELSGTLSGLFRVRCFHQDDAHIFMTPEQIKEEVHNVINLIDKIYSTFGLSYHMEFSTRPEKSIGTDEQWDLATNSLKLALEATGREYQVNEGDGAFYGPKIDFHIRDCLNRTWQCATIQLDMNLPERFDLNYEGKDGKKHRPVMIHRVIYGAIERFMGILIEHYAGKFPLWLSPEQVRILTVADRFNDYAKEIKEKMVSFNIRAKIDNRSESISKKVREAQLDKVNYILVVGEKELLDKTITIRTRDNQIVGAKAVDDFIDELLLELKERK